MNHPMTFTQENPKTKLNILCSARVRLTDSQRKILKDAYHVVRNQSTPDALPAIGGSSIRTETQFSVNSKLPLADITVIDLLNTRETIALTTVLSLQAALNVEALSKDEVLEAFKGYADYVFQIGRDGQ